MHESIHLPVRLFDQAGAPPVFRHREWFPSAPVGSELLVGHIAPLRPLCHSCYDTAHRAVQARSGYFVLRWGRDERFGADGGIGRGGDERENRERSRPAAVGVGPDSPEATAVRNGRSAAGGDGSVSRACRKCATGYVDGGRLAGGHPSGEWLPDSRTVGHAAGCPKTALAYTNQL